MNNSIRYFLLQIIFGLCLSFTVLKTGEGDLYGKSYSERVGNFVAYFNGKHDDLDKVDQRIVSLFLNGTNSFSEDFHGDFSLSRFLDYLASCDEEAFFLDRPNHKYFSELNESWEDIGNVEILARLFEKNRVVQNNGKEKSTKDNKKRSFDDYLFGEYKKYAVGGIIQWPQNEKVEEALKAVYSINWQQRVFQAMFETYCKENKKIDLGKIWEYFAKLQLELNWKIKRELSFICFNLALKNPSISDNWDDYDFKQLLEAEGMALIYNINRDPLYNMNSRFTMDFDNNETKDDAGTGWSDYKKSQRERYNLDTIYDGMHVILIKFVFSNPSEDVRNFSRPKALESVSGTFLSLDPKTLNDLFIKNIIDEKTTDDSGIKFETAFSDLFSERAFDAIRSKKELILRLKLLVPDQIQKLPLTPDFLGY